MFIHHVNGIDWLVITAFEELKPMFIEDAGPIPSYFSTASELSLIDQAKRSYGFCRHSAVWSQTPARIKVKILKKI